MWDCPTDYGKDIYIVGILGNSFVCGRIEIVKVLLYIVVPDQLCVDGAAVRTRWILSQKILPKADFLVDVFRRREGLVVSHLFFGFCFKSSSLTCRGSADKRKQQSQVQE